LTRDRRGFENTFLMHADRPGDRPRLLYWYRTAPGIVLGRPALDEDAIRTIEEQHPDIDFDWPAILALSEVMTPEEEAPARPPKKKKPGREPRSSEGGRSPASPPASAASTPSEPRAADQDVEPLPAGIAAEHDVDETEDEEPPAISPSHHVGGLLEELVGREIATRLRARYSEIQARIHQQHVDPALREEWLKRAAAIDPDLWLTPDAILDGVRNADAIFTQLHAAVHAPRD
jgi:hypothetical protein